ncbi:hypothetical protein J4410_07145 [Candidatus Woesearchaeota archaeon]|nr:hypothetical protein [Candidatus Woesearchaeota archaeon]
MTNVMQHVTALIDQDVSLRRSLTRGFVNTRALALYIQNHLEISASLDAIISAIRRYDLSNTFKDTTKKRYEIIAKAKISSRTNLCSLLLKKEKEVQEILSSYYLLFDFSKGEIFRILESSQNITLILDDTQRDTLKNMFKKTHILSTTKNLGEISLIYPLDISSFPGIFAAVNSEIALNNIAIKNAILCESEHTIILHEKDIIPTLNILSHIRSWDAEKKKQSY